MIYYNYVKIGHISRYCSTPRKVNYGQARLNAIIPEAVGYKEIENYETKYEARTTSYGRYNNTL